MDADERDVSALVDLIIMLSKDMNLGLRSSSKTSSEELEALRNRGYVAQSKKLINMLREAKDNDNMKFIHFCDIKYITECLKKLHFEPEAVGTTSSEIKELKRETLLVGAKDNLKKARENAGNKSVFSNLNLVMKVATKEGISLKEIGINLEEIDQLQRI